MFDLKAAGLDSRTRVKSSQVLFCGSPRALAIRSRALLAIGGLLDGFPNAVGNSLRSA